jgi:hypothetical protein
MTIHFQTRFTPRNKIRYDKAPSQPYTVVDQDTTSVEWPKDYGPILDSVYEMADQIMTGNGVSARQAIEQVIKDERWKILPTHIDMLVRRLEAGA